MCNDGAAAISTLRPEINNVICALYQIEVMLYCYDGISVIGKTLQDSDKLGYVLRVKSGCRLIKYISRLTGRSLGKLGSELNSLRFTTRKSS